MRFVGVTFKSSTMVYEFKTDLDLTTGDVVVCDTAAGLSVGIVVSEPASSFKATKWVVGKVDMTKHTERIIKENEIAAIKLEMKRRRAEIEEMNAYSQLARQDNEMAILMQRLDTLDKTPEKALHEYTSEKE